MVDSWLCRRTRLHQWHNTWNASALWRWICNICGICQLWDSKRYLSKVFQRQLSCTKVFQGGFWGKFRKDLTHNALNLKLHMAWNWNFGCQGSFWYLNKELFTYLDRITVQLLEVKMINLSYDNYLMRHTPVWLWPNYLDNPGFQSKWDKCFLLPSLCIRLKYEVLQIFKILVLW